MQTMLLRRASWFVEDRLVSEREDLFAYYAGQHEGQRLFRFGHNRLELLRTRELLQRQPPSPPAVVLDVGGGTGVHAGSFAGRGHRVHLVDVVPEHVRAAAEHGLVTAETGDARRLTQADASVATHPPLLPTQIARGASPSPRFRSLTHIWSDRGRALIVTRSRIADAAEGAR
jgi:protein-L-isoaspartate O-methyltransferase